MNESKPVKTPMNESDKPSKHDKPTEKRKRIDTETDAKKRREMLAELKEEIKQMKRTPYRGIIGSLSHLTRMTRPEIQFAVFYHARYQNEPGRKHWISAKRMLRYLLGTKDIALEPNRDAPLVEIYSDSDYMGDPDEAKSTTGIVIKVYGIPVLVKSRLQTLNAKSTTQAEIIAMCDAAEEAIWITNLLIELGEHPKPIMQADNQPSISTIENTKINRGNKHIANKYYFVKGYVQNKDLTIKYIPSKENIADICTKPLPRPAFEYLRSKLYHQHV